MNSSYAINKLEAEGWVLVRISGSHHYFRKEGFQRPVCIPHPKKDLSKGLIKAIERESGVKLK